MMIARPEVPDLASRIAQKRAEVREVQSRLNLLEAGPRYEEVIEQRRRVERAEAWRDRAMQDLARARKALQAELTRLTKLLEQYDAELHCASDVLTRSANLLNRRAISVEDYRGAQKQVKVFRARGEQTQAQKRALEALGTQQAEAEIARREKELADARAILRLLEAGTRMEEIDAERARRARLEEEARYLEALPSRLKVTSPVAGVLTTAHLKEKIGQYLREGDLIGVIEESNVMVAEIALPEQESARVRTGQPVELKARALPFDLFTARVDRIAPTAGRGEVQSTITLSCQLESSCAELRPGMTGHARISTSQKTVGSILFDRGLRFLRTEFWW
jgi:multidrug resistance efflux pump